MNGLVAPLKGGGEAFDKREISGHKRRSLFKRAKGGIYRASLSI
jgi:hypothetical protein